MTMSLRTHATLLVATLLISACASNEKQLTESHLQEAALQRWADCIDRQSQDESVADALVKIDQYCEGHKRDLMAAYPEHLESQIESTLTENTRKRAARAIALHSSSDEAGNISVTLK